MEPPDGPNTPEHPKNIGWVDPFDKEKPAIEKKDTPLLEGENPASEDTTSEEEKNQMKCGFCGKENERWAVVGKKGQKNLTKVAGKDCGCYQKIKERE